MGGMSTERGVSIKSGKAVSDALRSRGHTVIEIDVGPNLPSQLIEQQIDVAWIALHGAFGEDGCVQGLLEVMRIPYTGSGVRPSAIAMDKITTKRLLQDSDIALPPDEVWRRGDPIPTIKTPVVVKTPSGGSTIGVYICHDQSAVTTALAECEQWANEVLIEKMIAGDEITVAVLDGQPLPVVLIQPDTGFFDFDAKYTEGKTQYIVPAPLPRSLCQTAQRYASIAYNTLGLSGIARADFIVDSEGIPWFLEINTAPGMTATSLSPMAANAIGIEFPELVERLLSSADLCTPISESNQT